MSKKPGVGEPTGSVGLSVIQCARKRKRKRRRRRKEQMLRAFPPSGDPARQAFASEDQCPPNS